MSGPSQSRVRLRSFAGWLEPVLSWPRRFIVGADDQLVASAVREPAPAAG